MKKIFSGNVKRVSPKRLISDKNNNLENFFLVLSLIFNDIKGLMLMHRDFYNTYKKPEEGEISFHSGEHTGVSYQLIKLLIGTISEMFSFFDKNIDVINSIDFQLLLKSLDKETRREWDSLLKHANLNRGDSKFSFFVKIRSNVAFHYDQNLSELKKSFVDFFSREEDVYRYAYYSFGTVEETRFFYADAALQGYINSKIGSQENFDNIFEIVNKANRAISNLIYQYFKTKGIEK